MTYILCHFHEDVMFTSLVIFVGKPKNWLLSIISLCNSLILQIAFGVSHSLSLISHRPLIYRDKNCPTQRDLMGKTPPFWRNIYVLKTPSIHNSSDFRFYCFGSSEKMMGEEYFRRVAPLVQTMWSLRSINLQANGRGSSSRDPTVAGTKTHQIVKF